VLSENGHSLCVGVWWEGNRRDLGYVCEGQLPRIRFYEMQEPMAIGGTHAWMWKPCSLRLHGALNFQQTLIS